MVLQANGSWRAYSSTKAAAMPVDVAQLLLGGHRLGHWSVAEGRWSPAVRLAHDKHIHHIVSLVRSGAYTWATACAVENDDVSPAAFGGVHLVFDRAQLALRYVLCVRGADVRPTEVESEEAEADAVAVEEKEPELAVDTSSIEAAVASVADAAVSPAAAAVDDDAMDVDL